jgi:hypothetical protein
MILLRVVLSDVAMLRAATAPWPAIALLLCSLVGIFIAVGPPQPGALILLFATFGIASVWLGYAARQADYQRRPKESRANRSSSSLCTELDAPEKKPAKLRA